VRFWIIGGLMMHQIALRKKSKELPNLTSKMKKHQQILTLKLNYDHDLDISF